MFSPLQAPSLHSQEINFTRPSNRMHTVWRLIFYSIVDTTCDLSCNNNSSQNLFLYYVITLLLWVIAMMAVLEICVKDIFLMVQWHCWRKSLEHVVVCWIQIFNLNVTYSNCFINTENILVTKEILLNIISS